MAQGWISLNRQITDNWIWKDKPYAKGQAWIDILLRVNHKANKVPIGNSIIEVNEGETIWSIEDMANRWGWSRKKVSNFLNILETESQIVQKRTSKYTLVTVVNWGLYQTKEQQKNINGTSKEHQKNTNNNDNKENNEIINKKPLSKKFDDDSEEIGIAKYLFLNIQNINPNAKQPNYQTWAKHADYMLRVDKRSKKDIKTVIDFATKDSFWQSNILSTKKLRDKFDTLYLQATNKRKPTTYTKPDKVKEIIETGNKWLERRQAIDG